MKLNIKVNNKIVLSLEYDGDKVLVDTITEHLTATYGAFYGVDRYLDRYFRNQSIGEKIEKPEK